MSEMVRAAVMAGPGRLAIGRFLPLPKKAGRRQLIPILE